jgi:putative ABC transport system permease protein
VTGRFDPQGGARPPRFAEALLARLLPPQDRGPIMGDLAEEFAERVASDGARAAGWWYRRHVIRSLLPALDRRRHLNTRRGADRMMARLGSMWLDTRLGIRMLGKYPGLTAVAILALAIGIPAGVAPTHVANAWDAPPPLDEAERLQVLRNVDAELAVVRPTALYDYVQWRESLTSYSEIGASIDGVYNVTAADGITAPVEGVEVTSSVFEVLRVAPFTGRTLVAADDAIGAPDVAVIGHDLWQARFSGDPGIVGRVIDVGGIRRTVVGVMPETFRYPWSDQLWIPLRERAFADNHSGARMVRVMGRLKDGVSPEDAQMELTAVGQRMAVEFPEAHERLRAEVVPFTAGIARLPKGGLRALPLFYPIQVLTVLMLLFPSINIGMLVLARTAARSTELAVRMALGASRVRIVAQLFMESFVLAVVAGGAGFIVIGAIGRFLEADAASANSIDFGMTTQTMLLGLALAALSASVVGVIPALKMTAGRNIHRRIQHAAAGRAGVRFGWMSTSLIVVDVALAVAIISISVGIWSADPRDGMGIEADQYLAAELRIPRVESVTDMADMNRDESARLVAAQTAFMERLAAEPGVGAVAVASVLPGMDHSDQWFEMDDGSSRREILIARVDVGFFDALGQPILSGRGFDSRDIGEHRATVIVNTSFVERMLGGQNPIGRRVRPSPRRGQPGPWFEIVGVVGHLGMFAGEAERDAGMYFPVAPGELYPVPFAIRVGDDPVAFTPRLRALAREADPNAIIWAPVALSDVFNLFTFLEGRLRLLFLVVAGILLTISTAAVYALMSFTVAQRRRELGIRIALGAGWSDVVSTIARHAAVQLSVGALAGMVVAWVLLNVLESVLGQTSKESPMLVALVVTLGVVCLVGTLACIAPTRRALRIAPTEALAEK